VAIWRPIRTQRHRIRPYSSNEPFSTKLGSLIVVENAARRPSVGQVVLQLRNTTKDTISFLARKGQLDLSSYA